MPHARQRKETIFLHPCQLSAFGIQLLSAPICLLPQGPVTIFLHPFNYQRLAPICLLPRGPVTIFLHPCNC